MRARVRARVCVCVCTCCMCVECPWCCSLGLFSSSSHTLSCLAIAQDKELSASLVQPVCATLLQADLETSGAVSDKDEVCRHISVGECLSIHCNCNNYNSLVHALKVLCNSITSSTQLVLHVLASRSDPGPLGRHNLKSKQKQSAWEAESSSESTVGTSVLYAWCSQTLDSLTAHICTLHTNACHFTIGVNEIEEGGSHSGEDFG